jgi:hypothetical protein
MPDFERLGDGLAAHLARTPEEMAYEKGFQEGKAKARKEIMKIGIGFAIGWILWSLIRAA